MPTMRMAIVALAGIVLASSPAAADPTVESVTVLAGGRTLEVERALVEGEELWVPAEALATISGGFEAKPEGFCRGEVCIPIPDEEGWRLERDGETYWSATRLATRLEQPFVAETRQNVWSFGEALVVQRSGFAAAISPEFVLPDRSGNEVRLSDFRGKKVLLLAWASW